MDMKMLYLIFVSLHLCFCVGQITSTKDNEACVLLKDCPSAWSLSQEEIQNRICGYENNRYIKIRCVVNCVTPDSEKGVCTLADSCEPFKAVFLNSDPKNVETRLYLRKFICSSISTYRKHYVCCPNKPLPSKHTTPSSVTSRPQTGVPTLNNQRCGIATDEYKVVNGEIASIGEHPWAVLLQYMYRGKASTNCGGTLLNNRYVLTAAHCIDERAGKLTNVILGEHNTSSPIDCYGNDCAPSPKIIRIEKIIQHSGWVNAERQFYDDIALLRLAQDVEFSDFIQPICLPKYVPSRANKLVVVGWGKTEYGGASDVKRIATLPLQESSRCLNTIPIPIKQTQLCVGGQTSDSCKGDSGGPLVMPIENSLGTTIWHLVGVVSLGYDAPCGTPGKPGIYTSVYQYLNWIQENIY